MIFDSLMHRMELMKYSKRCYVYLFVCVIVCVNAFLSLFVLPFHSKTHISATQMLLKFQSHRFFSVFYDPCHCIVTAIC
jgi:hypothetical protein